MYRNLKESYEYANIYALHNDIKHMNMSEELNEQMLIFRFLDRDTNGVLEFGGNIGRSSIVINKLMKNPENHVVFESDPDNAKILEENKKKNGCKFHVVTAGLSSKPLIQNGWHTKIDDGTPYDKSHWKPVSTITLEDLKKMYPISFDTLVIDCEGCIIPILKDYGEELIATIKTVIIENDDCFF